MEAWCGVQVRLGYGIYALVWRQISVDWGIVDGDGVGGGGGAGEYAV